MEQSAPNDFARNYANWARSFGLTDWADWLARYATGPRVFWTTVVISLIYLAITFGVPAIIKKTKRNTAAVYVPLTVTALVIGSVYACYVVTSIGEWYISPSQDASLRAAIAAAPTQINPVHITVVPAAGTYAVAAAYQIMYALASAPGWHADLTLDDGEYSPLQTGLRISVKLGTDPQKNPKAILLKSVLEKAGFHPELGQDHMMSDPTEAKLVVGKGP